MSSSNSCSHSSNCLNSEMLEWEEWDGKGKFIHHMIAGSLAGVAEHLALFPMDTLKTQIQFTCQNRNSCNSPSISTLLRQQGFLRLWRGSSCMFSGCIPAHAAYFSTFEAVKKKLSSGNIDEPSSFAIACAGACASLAHDLIITPMDVCKQRLQLGYYKGLHHCLTKMARQEGIRVFYLSLPTTLAIQLPYACVMTLTNETLKASLEKRCSQRNIGIYLLSGGIAGAVAAAVTTPMDVVKTRIQTQGVRPLTHSNFTIPRPSSQYALTGSRVASYSTIGGTRLCSGFMATVKTIYAEGNGYRGFFSGVVPRMVIHAPSVAISWTVYESIKNILEESS